MDTTGRAKDARAQTMTKTRQNAPLSATVPSSENVFGSRNTVGSASRFSCTYITLWFWSPVL